MTISDLWNRLKRSTATATPTTGAARPGNAAQDAGWVHLVSSDGTLDFGRGHLKMWMERPGSSSRGRQAQLDSFTPNDIEPRRGDRAGVRPETESATYPVVIRGYDKIEGTTAVVLDWVDEEQLPAMLLETGGEGSGEDPTRAERRP